MILVYPNRDALRSFGLSEDHTHIPEIIYPGNRLREAELYSPAGDYLRSRAGLSNVRITYPPGMAHAGRTGKDSPATTSKVVSSLVNFFNYCNRRNTDWKQIQSGHANDVPSVLHWAFASLNGSSGQSRILPATVGIHFQYVQHFLWWASEHGHREEYQPVDQKFSRGVRRTADVDDLVGIPTDDEVRRWLAEASQKIQRHTYLMIRLLLECGLRHAEACNLRVCHVPSKEMLEHGTEYRGGIFCDDDHVLFPMVLAQEDGTKYGRVRTAFLPQPLAEALNAWCRIPGQRPAAVRRFKFNNPGQPAPDRIFFNPATGKAYGKNHLNSSGIWKLPTLSNLTSAHKFRHYFASRCMLRMTLNALKLHREISGMATGSLLDNALDEGERQLQAQLGHSNPNTTRIYRRWVDGQLAGIRQLRYLKGDQRHD